MYMTSLLRRTAPGLALCGALGVTQALALDVQVLSSRPDMVTGGDALVKVTGVTAAPTVSVAGKDVAVTFAADPKGGFVGLLTGLTNGSNAVVVKQGSDQKAVTLTNYGINDTLFAGPQQQPYICENDIHKLAKPSDAQCAAPTVIEYWYRSSTLVPAPAPAAPVAGAGPIPPASPSTVWKVFNPNGARPTDIAMTTTSEGKTVPLIVRIEKGVINRAAYAIGLLHDPAAGPPPTPTNRGTSGWNGKLIYSYAGGLLAGYHMGTVIGAMDAAKAYVGGNQNQFQEVLIEKGYAQAAGSLNAFRTTTNDVVSAETTAKIKERFIELYGQPMFTIGNGGSGGSMQQHLIANNYPGLLDGIFPRISYPDAVTFFWPLYDCDLLVNYFKRTEVKWSEVQKNLVSGKVSYYYCPTNGVPYTDQNLRVDVACDPVVKAAVGFGDIKQPRCTYQDNLVNIFGTDPKTGFARNAWDNVGVQYGLSALNEGAISIQQFIDLNGMIGGHDVNGRVVPKRSVGDPEALKIIYQSGRINMAGAGLAEIPIIDYRGYTDGSCTVAPCPPRAWTNVDIHDGYHSETMRMRLLAANGTAVNHVMLMSAETGDRGPDSPLSKMSYTALDQMDRWLTGIANDTSSRSKIEKIAAHRPADLVDSCTIDGVNKIADWNRCLQLFPKATNARIVAGAPRIDDAFKCQLKPVDGSDYKVPVSAAQLTQLKQIFADGVCDWGKAPVGRVALGGTWGVYSGDAKVMFLEPLRRQ